jgi:hypothetical protein
MRVRSLENGQMKESCRSSCSIFGGVRGDCLLLLFTGAYTPVNPYIWVKEMMDSCIRVILRRQTNLKLLLNFSQRLDGLRSLSTLTFSDTLATGSGLRHRRYTFDNCIIQCTGHRIDLQHICTT